ncbi:MAG: 23S rRNA (pseudouridine(1915)-N(3))-methyltransferase RlmH [Anaerococcus sp.]|uniref:Ribosomal RNA large subunit methyltransferase H n=1 Tax=Anaerococcus nagyae TaxID=1755241 RepID=A0A3E2TKH6_9FIRM|nr:MULTISPECIES: 23S rRNA (pseudouridine(1915)-N(3))-methyltransferase RlmH [Anaerococcus]MBP2068914.1 23S rRNA (pseudouridine1915-N3)-methyltransferase [Anaerococcus nagyae]MDU2354610.1 23S rRNA (pseudouridine(1915)-N(3))-methyltransferase RlmH [Anaerococcus sp.]MDU3212124.1 23S rRNA (pseudouridine(1915)-N(3))-methyltransferase RlmH [Anaerococcus sp.]RGB77881.1 23S rRNA (pseudouridine(1915)-N(3))-methyltransferase RlmH [Anaerococcus nagyae]
MDIKIIAVGKIKEKFYKQAIEEYLKRMQTYNNIEIIEVADEPAGENLSEKEIEQVKDKEGEKILNKVKDDDYVVSLEILGKQETSESFAKFIETEMAEGFGRNLVFIIGGSNGLSKNVSQRANKKQSFSKMTYPHQLMRVILIEQIYRAFRIINGHPYHK